MSSRYFNLFVSFVKNISGVSYVSKKFFDAHESSDCGRTLTFKCTQCAKAFHNELGLTSHLRTHSMEKKFKCRLCEQSFRWQSNMRKHEFAHTGERPHKCPYCEKCFSEKSAMKIHTITHTGIKRHVCHGCGKRFPTNSKLHEHRKNRKDTCALVPIQPPLRMSNTST